MICSRIDNKNRNPLFKWSILMKLFDTFGNIYWYRNIYLNRYALLYYLFLYFWKELISPINMFHTINEKFIWSFNLEFVPAKMLQTSRGSGVHLSESEPNRIAESEMSSRSGRKSETDTQISRNSLFLPKPFLGKCSERIIREFE